MAKGKMTNKIFDKYYKENQILSNTKPTKYRG
jgi:hypothetical protein